MSIIFFFFWLHWVFVAACRLSSSSSEWGYSQLQCSGFSLQWLLVAEHRLQAQEFSSCSTQAQQLWSTRVHRLQQFWHAGSVGCGFWALEHGLSSCGTRAYLFCVMWDLLEPGIEHMSPALVGGFLSTVSPWKSRIFLIFESLNKFLAFSNNHH